MIPERDTAALRAALATDPNPYKLVLEIGRESLLVIRAAQLRIVFGRSAALATQPNVVWLSLDPFELNTATWAAGYRLYASITSLVAKATVMVVSRSREAVASPGLSYTYTANAVFTGPFPGNVAPGEFGVLNQMPAASYPSLVFGLSQGATVQGNPVPEKVASAAVVVAAFSKVLLPLPYVSVWLQDAVGCGTYLGNPPTNQIVVDFSGGAREATLVYDPNTGKFVSPTP